MGITVHAVVKGSMDIKAWLVCVPCRIKRFSSLLMFIIFSKFDTIPILYKRAQNPWHKNSEGTEKHISLTQILMDI